MASVWGWPRARVPLAFWAWPRHHPLRSGPPAHRRRGPVSPATARSVGPLPQASSPTSLSTPPTRCPAPLTSCEGSCRSSPWSAATPATTPAGKPPAAAHQSGQTLRLDREATTAIDVHAHFWTDGYLWSIAPPRGCSPNSTAAAPSCTCIGRERGLHSADRRAPWHLEHRRTGRGHHLGPAPDHPQDPLHYRRVKILNSHFGGALPMLLQRMDTQLPREAPGTPETPSAAARRMWVRLRRPPPSACAAPPTPSAPTASCSAPTSPTTQRSA